MVSSFQRAHLELRSSGLQLGKPSAHRARLAEASDEVATARRSLRRSLRCLDLTHALSSGERAGCISHIADTQEHLRASRQDHLWHQASDEGCVWVSSDLRVVVSDRWSVRPLVAEGPPLGEVLTQAPRLERQEGLRLLERVWRLHIGDPTSTFRVERGHFAGLPLGGNTRQRDRQLRQCGQRVGDRLPGLRVGADCVRVAGDSLLKGLRREDHLRQPSALTQLGELVAQVVRIAGKPALVDLVAEASEVALCSCHRDPAEGRAQCGAQRSLDHTSALLLLGQNAADQGPDVALEDRHVFTGLEASVDLALLLTSHALLFAKALLADLGLKLEGLAELFPHAWAAQLARVRVSVEPHELGRLERLDVERRRKPLDWNAGLGLAPRQLVWRQHAGALDRRHKHARRLDHT